MHERALGLFGGATGIRDEGLLQSALARPRQIFAYEDNADLVRLAVAYAFGIVRNHPFVDGNKRTAFMTAVVFLERNGLHVVASESEAAQAVLELAAGTLPEGAFAAWLRDNTLKDNTKKASKRK